MGVLGRSQGNFNMEDIIRGERWRPFS